MMKVLPGAISLLMLFGNNGYSQSLSLVEANSYLIGEWSGEGKFLDTNIRDHFGALELSVLITQDGRVSATFDGLKLHNTTLRPANYGFEIRGTLDSFKKDGLDLKKDKLIILLVFPDENRSSITESDANFHLKSNFFFDFSMRVGGVILKKN